MLIDDVAIYDNAAGEEPTPDPDPEPEPGDFEGEPADANHTAQAYFWSFETGEEVDSWLMVDADGDGFCWEHHYAGEPDDSPMPLANNPEELYMGTDAAHSGQYAVSSASYSNDVGVLTPENWFISPEIVVPEGGASLYWYAAPQDYLWQEEHYKVVMSTSAGTEPEDFDKVLYEGTLSGLDEGEWDGKAVLLSAEAGTVRIAFVHYNCSDMYRLNLDDVEVKVVAGEDGLQTISISEMLENGPVYNLQGIRVNNANLIPGFYIVNGQKVFIR